MSQRRGSKDGRHAVKVARMQSKTVASLGTCTKSGDTITQESHGLGLHVVPARVRMLSKRVCYHVRSRWAKFWNTCVWYVFFKEWPTTNVGTNSQTKVMHQMMTDLDLPMYALLLKNYSRRWQYTRIEGDYVDFLWIFGKLHTTALNQNMDQPYPTCAGPSCYN